MTTEEQNRLNKLEKIKSMGINPYPQKFDKKQSLLESFDLAEGKKVKTAGRIIMFRDMGKLTFAHLQDESGKMQIAFKQDDLGKDKYKEMIKILDMGDFIGVEGETFVTHKGEKSILVRKWTFLGKALKPLPEKWHGLKDTEAKYRQRYLDLISNKETMDRFKFRSDFLKSVREFYWKEKFYEVETPTLMHSATGAHAKPYVTHNNGLDIDVFLKISHELPLKELIVGGFEKIFEIGKAFRNEGIDPSHLPEHTHLEHYCAYWSFEDNIKFTEKMFDYIFDQLKIDRKIKVAGKDGKVKEVDFTTPWKRIDYVELIKKDCGVDVLSYKNVKDLVKDLKKKKIQVEDMDKIGMATLVDNLYKKVSRPKIAGPVILYNYPVDLQPLARRSDKNPELVEQFQLLVNGWELVKAYSELVDPLDQQERFEEQARLASEGDDETMGVDYDYVDAMKYGMPPISGWGMGVDRLLTILTQQENLRDVVLFPLMKSKEEKGK
ncbi:lysine--tRNA ligase [Candidatus Falkowbacteria bacterium]|jgi:lysyl-tRNA synthetase, class II|nr:lysine--tRNA ligase [Candidatus Falkowbacteria bacterium]